MRKTVRCDSRIHTGYKEDANLEDGFSPVFMTDKTGIGYYASITSVPLDWWDRDKGEYRARRVFGEDKVSNFSINRVKL